jgi:hypothetical protein
MLLPALFMNVYIAGGTVDDVNPGILPADGTLHLLPPTFLKISNPNSIINRLVLHMLSQGFIKPHPVQG